MKFFMYLSIFILVTAATYACEISIDAINTDAFIQEIPSLNEKVTACSPEIPGYMKVLYKNGDFNVKVGDSKQFMLTLTKGKLTSFTADISSKPSYTAYISEADFDKILQSENMMGTMAYMYKQKRAKIEANPFSRKITLFFIRPFLNFGMGKAQVPLEE